MTRAAARALCGATIAGLLLPAGAIAWLLVRGLRRLDDSLDVW